MNQKRFNDPKPYIVQKVLLFNFRLNLISGKLWSRWDAFVITNVFSHGLVEIKNEVTGKIFKVNAHQLNQVFKLFHEWCNPPKEGTNHQRLMDKIFVNQLEKNLEVYVDDMVWWIS